MNTRTSLIFYAHRSLHPDRLRAGTGPCHTDIAADPHRLTDRDGSPHRYCNAFADFNTYPYAHADTHAFSHPAPDGNRLSYSGYVG